MLARIVVHASLFSCLLAIRDDASVHASLKQDSGITSMSRTVPLAVNAAIRKVNGRVSRKMKAIKAQMEAAKLKQKAAASALEEKKAKLEAVENKSNEYSANAKKAREAFAALEDAMEVHSSKNDDFEKAKEEWKTLDASVLEATEALGEKKEKAMKAQEEKEEELKGMETALDDKKTKRDEAEKALKEKEDKLKEAGDFKKNKADEHDKAEAAMHEARKALEKNQLLLDTAIDALKMASAEAKAATDHAKILEEEHGDDKKGLEMLMKVRSAILSFYGKLDELTVSMENQIAEKPDAVASEIMKADPYLKPTFEGYNEMVETFYALHGLDAELYGSIQDAVAQIKHNTFAAILLQCDPGETLEMQAEEKKDFKDLQEKCGTGLWKAAGLKRKKFPSFKGQSARIANVWWEASLEDAEIETNPESQPSDSTKDGDSQDSQDGLPQTIEAMETTSEPENVLQEERPDDVEAVDTTLPTEEGAGDEEAVDTAVPQEEGPDEVEGTAVPPEEGPEDE
mmetsp:Transcript_34037/g.55873  ORF Transcript_34037/g.55873 Transcript_34037/m.55873 type:complete len:514 (+) Transcript_34037:52-1593(+)